MRGGGGFGTEGEKNDSRDLAQNSLVSASEA